MNLTVVAGYREFFRPRRLAHRDLVAIAARISRDAIVPRPRWSSGDATADDADYLYGVGDRAEIDRRVGLFLEYLEDVAADGAPAVVFLPLESLAAATGDHRVEHFVARAVARFGRERVEVRRVALSAAAREVVRSYAAIVAPGPAGGDRSAIDLVPPGDPGDRFDELQRNYAATVVATTDGGRASTASIFRGARDVAEIVAALAGSDLRLRADVGPDRIAAELRPGGELSGLARSVLAQARIARAVGASLARAASDPDGRGARTAPTLSLACPPDFLPERATLEVPGLDAFEIGEVLGAGGVAGYEPEVLATLCALVETAGRTVRFLDVGANVGYFSLALQALFGGRVAATAFEPMPRLAEFLRATAARNGLPVEVRQLAVAAREGRAEFYLSSKSDMSNSLNARFRKHSEVLIVEVARLDDLLAEDDAHGLILKIDTESTEPDVLEGALGVIARARPPIVCEVLAGRTEAALTSILERVGYRGYHLRGSPSWEAEPLAGDQTYVNRDWLFLPEPPSAALRARFQAWSSALGGR